MGRLSTPRLGMPAWLPPAFTAPCRKPQADARTKGNERAASLSQEKRRSRDTGPPHIEAKITDLSVQIAVTRCALI
jgi:hypothetical protein